MRVEPLGGSGEKVAEGRSVLGDDLKEVEERARLAILQGKEDTNHMVAKEMSLRINNLESGLAREIKTSKALLSTQAELQVVSDLTRQVEENDSGIKKGLDDLSEITECTENLQRQVDVLTMKGKPADMAQYRIQALERTEELCQFDLNSCRIELERMRQKFIGKDDELRVARENLSASVAAAEHLQTALPAKDMEFREMQRRCDGLNERVARLKAERDQAITRAKKVEARERSGGSRTVIKAPLVQGDVVSLTSRIRDLESDVSRIQRHVQRGNTDLRECQHKLDIVLIREKILEGEIRVKDLLVKKKDDLLKDLPAREELNAELRIPRARVVKL
ncbi:hypothetical protein GIB67_007981 [Kingdonia uniflora]|uniref:Uncharacterized protein n=1 Tax=Kingdonia uniflora TaxID=39325 RepID=A0A7J7L9L6_9MAGN|nr:hypothetical protein GIB67_007981 [Kingdonia uniflora]